MGAKPDEDKLIDPQDETKWRRYFKLFAIKPARVLPSCANCKHMKDHYFYFTRIESYLKGPGLISIL